MASPQNSPLLQAQSLTLSYGVRPLFQNLSFPLFPGEKVGLIGPNGAGKSSLLKILAGESKADEGQVSIKRGTKIGFLKQVPDFDLDKTVRDTIMEGSSDPHDWSEIHLCETLLSQMGLDGSASEAITPETPVKQLSGGWKKRLALARELQRKPDILLLDEPTNHLDVEGILALEELLSQSSMTTLTVTHDRYFLDRVSTRIIELDRRNPQGLLSVDGPYHKYLEVKTNLMSAQESQETRWRNVLRREEEWLRRGAKARTTKQVARIQRAGELRQEVDELAYRNQNSKIRLELQSAEQSPKRLIEAKDISKSYGNLPILSHLSITITPGTRLGLLGPNGCGKSTLIRVLLGEEPFDSGSLHRADGLSVAYFEQNRDSLDPELSVFKTICPAGEYVHVGTKPVHAKGYLDRFLFRSEQHEMPVRSLSGGEQSRLLLARLFLQPAQILVLDEPTNDLDMQTLNVLEDALVEFPGAVILVSHDRYFMDRVSTKILGFSKKASDSSSHLVAYASLEQWETEYRLARQEQQEEFERTKAREKQKAKEANTPRSSTQTRKKLTFTEQHELTQMESTILQAEEKASQLQSELHQLSPSSHQGRFHELSLQVAAAQERVETLYARWSELQSLSEG